MPIFSLRSVRRMLDELAPNLQAHRLRELGAKIVRHGEQTVPAEWEIAVGYALSRVGSVSDPGGERRGNPDYIFLPKGSKTELLVEVTALSDKAANAENPVDDFSEKLGRIAVKEGITPELGALSFRLGDVEVDQRIILGVPDRRDMDALFKGRDFRSFLLAIKAAPAQHRVFRFVARGVESVISYDPGRQFAGGGYKSYKVARRVEDTSVFNALKRKERQLSAFGRNSPAIVFLCDNDSHLLKHSQMHWPGAVRIEDILRVFLDGRPRLGVGPWLVQEGIRRRARRIHAVVTLTVEEARELLDPRPRRSIRGRFVPAARGHELVRSQAFLGLVNEAVATLPSPISTALNARREYSLPYGFGGGSMSDSEVTISLLTLQKLLAGKISYERFFEAHGELAVQLKRLDDGGRMISSAEVIVKPDWDDDLVTLRFDNVQPKRLFDPGPNSKDGVEHD